MTYASWFPRNLLKMCCPLKRGAKMGEVLESNPSLNHWDELLSSYWSLIPTPNSRIVGTCSQHHDPHSCKRSVTVTTVTSSLADSGALGTLWGTEDSMVWKDSKRDWLMAEMRIPTIAIQETDVYLWKPIFMSMGDNLYYMFNRKHQGFDPCIASIWTGKPELFTLPNWIDWVPESETLDADRSGAIDYSCLARESLPPGNEEGAKKTYIA